jgi:hypothetical protein
MIQRVIAEDLLEPFLKFEIGTQQTGPSYHFNPIAKERFDIPTFALGEAGVVHLIYEDVLFG